MLLLATRSPESPAKRKFKIDAIERTVAPPLIAYSPFEYV
jgi:hypothetical protein